MKNLIRTMISATLLATPFTLQASDVSLDDAYRGDGRSAYEIDLATTPGKHIDVASSDMYRYEDSGAFHHSTSQLNSGETAEFAVFSVTTSKTGPAIPGYIGNY